MFAHSLSMYNPQDKTTTKSAHPSQQTSKSPPPSPIHPPTHPHHLCFSHIDSLVYLDQVSQGEGAVDIHTLEEIQGLPCEPVDQAEPDVCIR